MPHPLATVGHQGLGQVANAKVLGGEMPLAQGLAQVPHGPLGTVELITSF